MSTISIVLDERPQSIRDAVRNMLKLKKSKVFDPTSTSVYYLLSLLLGQVGSDCPKQTPAQFS